MGVVQIPPLFTFLFTAVLCYTPWAGAAQEAGNSR